MTRQSGAGRRRATPEAGPPAEVPSRQQYLDLKAQHPQALLLYRLGDFYETFDEDARIVSRDARILLTSRSFGRSGRVPMAGIPHHALNHYLGRLLTAGHTIAIAEQLSEPGHGLVERAITRVITPGTVAEPALLPATENRYLAALAPNGQQLGLAWVDVSTGEFAVLELSAPDLAAQVAEELARLNPAECLIPDRLADDPSPLPAGPWRPTRLEHWHFGPERARSLLSEHFAVRSLEAYGCAALPAAIGAAGAILAYLGRTNPTLLPLLVGLRTERSDRRVGLDAATRRNLELTRSQRGGGARGSLLPVLDATRTAMGSRTLRRWLGQPLQDQAELDRRQTLIAALIAGPLIRADLASNLAEIGDLERLTGRVTLGGAGSRDFLALGAALGRIPTIIERLTDADQPALAGFATTLDPCPALRALIEAAISDDEVNGPTIRPGFSPPLDEVRASSRATRDWLANLERDERERTGIRSLKIGFNKVFGYYIEVTRPNLPLVPAEYVRKQTIATGERFFTASLKEAEARLLVADEQIDQLERAALAELTERVIGVAARLVTTASQLAQLDTLLALATVAERAGWSRPTLVAEPGLTIVGGRHPVVEAGLAGEPFIPNDCALGGDQPRLLLVTGPNMGGKSTYLRQVALIVLLAHIGSFVPASSARIGLVDRIFTRVGAQDDIASGQSTFMVEMIETATILHQATARSLIILDEVGRGTSTDDGLAIARAVVEDLQQRIGARTLFATHYLELTDLAAQRPQIANVHVAALEADGRVIFLHAVRPGAADRAYGIQVARLAGLPTWVADRAEQLVGQSPSPRASRSAAAAGREVEARWPASSSPAGQERESGGEAGTDAARLAERLAARLRQLALDELTPRAALDWLYEQQAQLTEPVAGEGG